MITDIGILKHACISGVQKGSKWMNGLEWMRKNKIEFPVETVDEIKLKASELKAFNEECMKPDIESELWYHTCEEQI